MAPAHLIRVSRQCSLHTNAYDQLDAGLSCRLCHVRQLHKDVGFDNVQAGWIDVRLDQVRQGQKHPLQAWASMQQVTICCHVTKSPSSPVTGLLSFNNGS